MDEWAQMDGISERLLGWWDDGHVDLPWRRTKEPYAVWVVEVMLQQTQIGTVLPYYERWMARFPTVAALAGASLKEVLKLWEGLGYYSRARNLHVAAQWVMAELGGKLPATAAGWRTLKGVGEYTAGAVASIAFEEQVAVVDGNVVRVLSRLFDLAEDVRETGTKKRLWSLAKGLVPALRPGDHNQALMELGQTICLPAKPTCGLCPLRQNCLAAQRGTQLERPVKSPRKKTPHYDVVAGIIWGEDGRLLIAQRPLNGLLGGLWEFPGGKCESGESHEQALRREIMEELGIEVAVGNHQISLKHAYTHFRITLHTYHATYLAGEPQHLGVADHAWVYPHELESYPFAATDRQIVASLKSIDSDE